MYIWNISSLIVHSKSTNIYGKNWLQAGTAGMIDGDSSNHNRLNFRSEQGTKKQESAYVSSAEIQSISNLYGMIVRCSKSRLVRGWENLRIKDLGIFRSGENFVRHCYSSFNGNQPQYFGSTNIVS